MKKTKRILFIIIGIVFLFLIIISLALINENIKVKEINDDFSEVYSNIKYENSVYVDGITTIEQSVSCGFAVIEMFSSWSENNVTEESLYNKYGKVTTSTGNSFAKEMNRQFPDYTTTMYSYLSNTELLDKVYDSLLNGIPVPFEWAAKLGDDWTLHYSLIYGMDVKSDNITIANSYGYIEELKIEEFLNRTSFNAYEKMPLYFKLGFAFGFFERNTIFIIK